MHMQKLTAKEIKEINKKELEFMKQYPKAIPDEKYNYHCLDCKEELRAYYSLKTGGSIGLICPRCGKIHNF